MNDSIYSFISNAVGPDGLLPADFDLPKKKEDDKPLFADGALDGIQIYHMGFKVIEEPALAELLEILRTANSGEYDKAEKDLSGFFKEFRAIEIIDEAQNQIIDHKKEINAILEAKKLNVPVICVVDTNSDPDSIDHVIPANDDAIRSIQYITSKIADAVIDGKRIRETMLAENVEGKTDKQLKSAAKKLAAKDEVEKAAEKEEIAAE